MTSSRRVLPLKDNIPTDRFPVVTVALILINVAVFVWQLTLPSDSASSPALRQLGVSERDEAIVQYGAIPHRLTDPGAACAIGAVQRPGGFESQVVCEDSRAYGDAERVADEGGPFVPVNEVAWWITLLTSMFMHGGWLHIIGNMLFLWVFGNNVEDRMGRLRFVLFYVLAGLVAVYAQSLVDTAATVPTIGASGAVAGVLGGYILLHPGARVVTLVFIIFFVTLIEIPAMILLGIWAVLQFLPALGQLGAAEVSGAEVAYLAHVGGFLFGLAMIKLFTAGRSESGPALRGA
jgi:membrane associated rhomboid family serine protease